MIVDLYCMHGFDCQTKWQHGMQIWAARLHALYINLGLMQPGNEKTTTPVCSWLFELDLRLIDSLYWSDWWHLMSRGANACVTVGGNTQGKMHFPQNTAVKRERKGVLKITTSNINSAQCCQVLLLWRLHPTAGVSNDRGSQLCFPLCVSFLLLCILYGPRCMCECMWALPPSDMLINSLRDEPRVTQCAVHFL